MTTNKEITSEQWKLMKDIYNTEDLIDNPLGSIIRTDLVRNWQELCAQNCPHNKGLQFMLSGSKKEGGSEARFFSGKKPASNETDVMVTLEGQILQAKEEDLIICNPEHLGFVCLKNPGQKWLNAFATEIEKDVPVVIDESGITFICTNFCRQWIEHLVKNLGYDKEKYKKASMLDPLGVFQKNMDCIGFEAHGPAHTPKLSMVGAILPIFQRFLTRSKTSDPAAVDLLSQIVEEMDECSLDIDNCQAVASCGVNICLDQYTGVLTQDKILVYDKEDIKEYLMRPIKRMLSVLSLVKKFSQIEPFDFKIPPVEITHYFFGDVMRISKLFTDMRTSLEDFILWRIWRNLRADDFMDTWICGLDAYSAPLIQTDFVYSVKCAFWPEIAKPWIVRERPFDFPSPELCQEIASHGVHLVCKSYPSGDDRLTWRLSFSEAEIKLVSMRSAKQKLVYFIFKSIFYEQLKSVCDETTESSLSSYHVKTVMMWACEKRALEFWEKNSYYICLEALFTDLEVVLRTKNLPNYFISEINLLADCESILDPALDFVCKIQRNLESYPNGQTIEELLQQRKTSEKLLASTFELHQEMSYLQRAGKFDLDLFQSMVEMFQAPMDSLVPQNLTSLISEVLNGQTISLPTSRPVPDHVFGIDTAGLQSLTRLVTGCTFGNSTFFEEIVDDLQELGRNDLLRSLVYRMLLVDVDLQIKIYDEVLEELNLQGSIALELQKWFLYKLLKCMLSDKPSHELMTIANYVQGRSLLLVNTVLGGQTHDYGLIEESISAMEQWNGCDTSKEVQCLKVKDIEHIEQLQSGTIHFSAISAILCHFETMINEGSVSPSSLMFMAVVKHMRRQMTERMKKDLAKTKKKLIERPLQEYEDINLD